MNDRVCKHTLPQILLTLTLGLLVLLLASCDSASSAESEEPLPPLPDSAYYLEADLEPWTDPESGYDTARQWSLDGGKWPITIVMSPSQSPQLLVGLQEGLYQEALQPFGIEPELVRLDGPPRVFHALERSQWPVVYMPLAVFMDYIRSEDNQGGAGGLQYVAIAGSTSGGGYTLMARDPAIKSVADLAGKRVGLINRHPVPGTLLQAAARREGLELGDGENDVGIEFGGASDVLNRYGEGELDAVVSFNIFKQTLIDTGSHAVTDFSDLEYRPNYTILAVERSVYEERPEVVEAFLKAHLDSDRIARKRWDDDTQRLLFESWNAFFAEEETRWSSQRPVDDLEAFKRLLGDMHPDMRLDPDLVADCFAFTDEHDNWGWEGSVDTSRVVDYEVFDRILKAAGEQPQ